MEVSFNLSIRRPVACAAAILILIFLGAAADSIQAQQISYIGFAEDFEDNALAPNVTIQTKGTFTAAPGIKATGHFGSSMAFGFGKTDCAFNCWDDNTSTLRIELPEPAPITLISFDEAELDGNWGSTGYVYVDGHQIYDDIFQRYPANDYIPDSSFRSRNLMANLFAKVIEFKVIDITSSSEIYIDNIVIGIAKESQNLQFVATNFNVQPLPFQMSVQTKGTFTSLPGFRTPQLFGGSGAFGFGKSTCRINAFDDYVTSLEWEFSGPVFIETVKFQEAELDSNWGSQGVVYLDDQEIAYSSFGRLPSNTGGADSAYRSHFIPVHRTGKKISLRVTDITDLSEIVIDNLTIVIYFPEGEPVMNEDFEDGLFANGMNVIHTEGFNNAPGIKETNRLGGRKAFGFGQSTCTSDCYRTYQSSLIWELSPEVKLNAISFHSIELNTNFGSRAEFFVNNEFWPGMDFARQPNNDFAPDATSRFYHLQLAFPVHRIEWRVWDIADNSEVFIDDIALLSIEPGSVADQYQQPGQFALLHNYPNPFNSSTVITFSLSTPAPVSLTVYNTQGQIVDRRNLGKKLAGMHHVVWNGEKFASGSYFCRIETPEEVKMLKWSLIR